jgi:hypothetical protein
MHEPIRARERLSPSPLLRVRATFLARWYLGLETIIERPLHYLRARRLDTPLPREVHRSLSGTGLAHYAARAMLRCPSTLQGLKCSNTCELMRRLAMGLSLLNSKLGIITQAEHRSSDEVSCPSMASKQLLTRCHCLVVLMLTMLISRYESDCISTQEALQQALDLVQWTNSTSVHPKNM